MSRPRYVLTGVDRTPTLHRFPAFEECNLDDAHITNRFRTLGQVTVPYEPCGHCKPLEVDESIEPEDETPAPTDVPPAKGRAGRKAEAIDTET